MYNKFYLLSAMLLWRPNFSEGLIKDNPPSQAYIISKKILIRFLIHDIRFIFIFNLWFLKRLTYESFFSPQIIQSSFKSSTQQFLTYTLSDNTVAYKPRDLELQTSCSNVILRRWENDSAMYQIYRLW